MKLGGTTAQEPGGGILHRGDRVCPGIEAGQPQADGEEKQPAWLAYHICAGAGLWKEKMQLELLPGALSPGVGIWVLFDWY